MSKNKFIFFVTTIVILMIASIALAIVLTISFMRDIQDSTVYIESGDTVYVEKDGNHHIYFESNLPPSFFAHQFIFTNTETNAAFESFSPATNSTYSIGEVRINNEIRAGRFGRRIATANLDEGTYIVEFQPHTGGDFVWGSPMQNMLPFIIQLTFLSLLCSALFIALTVIIIVYAVKRKRQKEQEFFEANFPQNLDI